MISKNHWTNQFRFNIAEIRVALLESRGLGTSRGSGKWSLPMSFSTHPGFITYQNFRIKCLSSEEARRLNVERGERARKPKRILVWDEECQKWMFIGSFLQHCRTSKEHAFNEGDAIKAGYDKLASGWVGGNK
jgi:hypothetical protein